MFMIKEIPIKERPRERFLNNPIESISTIELLAIILRTGYKEKNVLDLSKEFDLGKKYECVISLEVGEHIPPKFEQTYLDNLDRHCSQCIIISWALPGQGGAGHVNEKDNSYVKNEFKKRGYKSWVEAENHFRNSSTFGWFKNTIMIFLKK